MGVLEQSRFVERLQFFDGQRLFADDLQGLEAFHREMRELHNRSLHQPGIGAGLAVYGDPGDREVVVGPGYALDDQGHEIVLTADHTEPIPTVQGAADGSPALYDLAVSYPEDDRLEVTETREGVCLPRGAVRLREEPVFCWIRLHDDGSGEPQPDAVLREDIAIGRRILLARAEVQHCQLVSLSIAERRNARPPSHPLIACGREEPPQWQVEVVPMRLFGSEERELLLLEADISTVHAGFVNTPCYTARLEGRRVVPILMQSDEGSSQDLDVFAEGVVSVREPTPEGFSLRVFVLSIPFGGFDMSLLGNRLAAEWNVEWMGVD